MSAQLNNPKERGFTIVELMIVMVIASILATLAGPSFSAFMNNTRQNSAQSQLLADLNRARSEAIKRNARILVCNANTAGTDCANTTDWSSGWLVCRDVDADGACDATSATDPNPMVLRGALNSSLTLTSTANVVRFNSIGTAGAEVTLSMAGDWGEAQTKTLVVKVTGSLVRGT
ncbi:MAG: GspH/FimT family pseudopilin [Gallionella sp.]|nr:GspH/FimT family pseudopilin [Gallionella sp.]